MTSGSDDSARLTLRGVEVFVAVVEEGSLAGGARRLGASPSSVSQQIANLETALGARLIERAARPIQLTPAGYLFQRRALAILTEAARARSELAELELSALPRLRLAVIDDLHAETTPRLVAHIARQMPESAISVQSGPSHENLAALEARSVDIVVAADEFDAPDWIERHLRRLRLSPPRKFEFSAVDPLFAATAHQGGWTLATPLCWLRARHVRDALDIAEMPFRGFARTVSLLARRDALGSLPAQLAEELRRILAVTAIKPGIARMPWLDGEFRILERQA